MERTGPGVSRETPPGRPLRAHWVIRGGVQGVGYRMFALRAAQRLQLDGYVRNRPDGSVQVEVSGTPADLAAFHRTLASGPPHAHVLEIEDLPPGTTPLPSPFRIS